MFMGWNSVRFLDLARLIPIKLINKNNYYNLIYYNFFYQIFKNIVITTKKITKNRNIYIYLST